ncbi:hypothetical protein AYO21_01270 [Fonsecaea monophora]|uniref:Uncharacterized protein n=1 Tax=Fonsecaea monophora TaxID=254056 RepID=A0A177FJ09_9EURO|nr:hypothetical protein AYO21_01270 [Fonsecaea monophora]OAG44274.1 hypothetical protein AYO21_01270 [Fonsecaea monophora]
MPTTQGFEFLVEGVDGVPFATYGTRSLGRSIVSTKIQAKTGVSFQIRVKPQNPFPTPNDAPLGQSRYNLRPSTRRAELTNGRNVGNLESPGASADPKASFLYVAFVYIDGNKKAECSNVVVVNPESRKYSEKGCLLPGRYSLLDDTATQNRSDQGERAHMSICPWVFTERGIDVLMSRMNISTADPDIPATAMEQELVDLTHAMDKDKLGEAAQFKRGEIEVKIIRVLEDYVVGSELYWKRENQETPKDDDGQTHDVTVDRGQEQQIHMHSVKYRRYRRDEAFWCKAVFQYMDIAKLVNLGLCNPHGGLVERPQGNTIGSSLQSLSSLQYQLMPGQLKRTRGGGQESGKHGESELDRFSSSEDSASTTTSDSDVPHRKRRGPMKRRGAKASKKKMTMGETRRGTARASAGIQGPGVGAANRQLQLEKAAGGQD